MHSKNRSWNIVSQNIWKILRLNKFSIETQKIPPIFIFEKINVFWWNHSINLQTIQNFHTNSLISSMFLSFGRKNKLTEPRVNPLYIFLRKSKTNQISILLFFVSRQIETLFSN